VTKAQHAVVKALLEAGKDVVVDDTNLRLKHARAWADLATSTGSDFQVWDITTSVEDCLRNDEDRRESGERYVGERVIREFASRYRIPWPEVTPTQRTGITPAFYVPNQGNPCAWIFDIDGTLAQMNGRSPFSANDEDYLNDTLDKAVFSAYRGLYELGYYIVVMSGRDESHREVTEKWLERNLVSHNLLLMRPEGDTRKDFIVKGELFDMYVRDNYNVCGVFDDRNQVVDMWRSIGLKCFQVQDGNY
jgi:hypothetical protein